MTAPHAQPRSSFRAIANVGRDAQPMSERDKRELGRRLWLEYGAVCVLPSWAPSMFWDALCSIARRLYGPRQ